MSLRGVLSLTLYYIGDYVCEVTFHRDIRWMWIYKLYSYLMLYSNKLDTKDEVWNQPEDGMPTPKHLRNDDEL